MLEVDIAFDVFHLKVSLALVSFLISVHDLKDTLCTCYCSLDICKLICNLIDRTRELF